jgi:hypothetical protein
VTQKGQTRTTSTKKKQNNKFLTKEMTERKTTPGAKN